MKWRWHTVDEWIAGKGFTKGAEIGVKEGRFIHYLLANNPDLTMIAIDPWENQPEKAEDYIGWDWDKIYKAYVDRITPYQDRVREFQEYSQTAAAKIPDGSLDFVFIDAQHDFSSVMRDIELWQPKVKTGGLISGHDYCDKFPGVMLAVDEFLGKPITGENDVWGHWKNVKGIL